jgi:hypothetical protein
MRNASSRCVWSQLWTGWGWVRSRIEAHSDRHQRRGDPGEELHGPDRGLTEHRHYQHSQSRHHRPRRAHGQQPEAETDQQGQIGDQQRRVGMHQSGDLDSQSRDGAVRAGVAGVRPRRGDEGPGHQHRSQCQPAERGQHPQRPGDLINDHPVVRLADLDEQQHCQPHHRHRRQQVNGHRPPQQAGPDGDAADHRLQHGRCRHQPGVDQHLAPSVGTNDRQHRQRRGEHYGEGDHSIAEFNGLMDPGDLGMGDRSEAAREALRPGRAAQPRRGDANDRPRHGDAALRQDHQRRDDPLHAKAGAR